MAELDAVVLFNSLERLGTNSGLKLNTIGYFLTDDNETEDSHNELCSYSPTLSNE